MFQRAESAAPVAVRSKTKQMKNRTVGIIGGGASGLIAAISAARAGAQVTLIEHMDRVGKKILSTGNGRCNLTNYRMEPECYHCSQKDFPMKVIQGFGVEETLEFFKYLGIVPKDRNGYVYPNSDQAASVLDVLRWETERLGIRVLLSCQVSVIKPQRDGGFLIWSSQGTLYKQLAGIRTEARIRLLADGICMAEDKGELQLTDYGLSGIPVFQISRYASRALDKGSRVRASIDFMPSWKEDEAFRLLKKRAVMLKEKPVGELFTGMLNRKLAQVLIKLSGIDPSALCERLGNRQLERILYQLKSYEAIVMSVNPFSNAQVCCGGVDTREVDPDTMESRIRTGLYLAGELLDVDGICGGYNLQFAWSSGWIAGQSAAGIEKPHRK